VSILWCGGEDLDFPIGRPVMTTGGIRTGFSRLAINLYSGPGYGRSTLFPGGGVTSCWFSWRQQGGCQGTSTSMLGLGDSDNNGRGIWLRSASSGTGAMPSLWKYDGTTWTELVKDNVIRLTDQRKMDLNVVDYGATGHLYLYIDGSLILSYDGDISSSGVTHLDCIILGQTPNSNCYISELIVADEDTRSFGLVTLYPNADGDSKTNWSGGYADIAENTLSENTVMASNTSDADAQINLYPTPSGSYTVKAVQLSARAVKTADGTTNGLALGIKSNSSYDYGSKQNLSVAWDSYLRLMTVNPLTSSPWTPAELDALQLNMRAKT